MRNPGRGSAARKAKPATVSFTLSWDGRMIEEGESPENFRALIRRGAVDELRITWRPCVIGGKRAQPITGLDARFLPRGVELELVKMTRRGDDCIARYRVRGEAS
jgi:hypothetical protein